MTPDTSKLKSMKNLSLTEKIIYWTIVLTPLWWLLGIQPFFYPAVVISLLLLNFNLDKLISKQIPVCVWAWLAMSLAMLWTAAIALGNIGFAPIQVAAIVVTFAKSYFLIFACLVLPFWCRIRVSVITRAVAWMAVGYLVVIFIQLILLFLGITLKPIYSPLAHFSTGKQLSLAVKLTANFKPFFGVLLPRSSLYMPDPPIPGICGILCFFICLGESNPYLRRLALAGSVSALIISQSRLALICFPLALIINASFRSHLTRQASLWLFSLTALISAMLQLTLADLLHKSLTLFNKARPASSTDREFVVRKTIEAWQQSPWIGWGIPQDTAKWHTYDVTLGSFSTYTAVLYLHGIVGFICLIIALISTICTLWKSAIEGSILSKRALASFMALSIFLHGLPLSWITVYFWFFFLWLGVILSVKQSKHSYSYS
jgi:hypothetical protein